MSPGGTPEAASRTVLVIDTDPGVRWALENGLRRSGYDVRAVSGAGEGLEMVHRERVDAVVLEILPEAGLTPDLLGMLLDTPAPPRIICVSIESAPQIVIECMRRGASDFLPKPFSLLQVREALSRATSAGDANRPPIRPRPSPGAAPGQSYLIGISPSIQELRVIIERVAQTDLNCLIRGESGTGKDMVARELHRLSARSDKPFVKVNCSALPEQLLESELFGYEKGAFTGAVSAKPGRFELAHRGVIFLDEIGDMHANLQSKLLQVIEHKEFTKLGGKRAIHVDVQILAATNANLEQRTKEGAFRHDLYFRLNEVCIWVPPLSARKEDVPLLVRHFIQKHGRFTGGVSFEIAGDDLAELTRHDWPGNVRELESTIKRWLALGKNLVSTPRHERTRTPSSPLPEAFAPGAPGVHELPDSGGDSSWPSSAPEENGADAPRSKPQGEISNERLLEVLERHHWNRRKAAEELGMSYQTLRRRVQKLELDSPPLGE